MTNVLQLSLALGLGIGLGLAYFLTLWKTVQRLPFVSQPILWTLMSFVLRLSLVLTGFYLVMGGRSERLMACFLGFYLMRSVLAHRWGPNHAPAGTMKV